MEIAQRFPRRGGRVLGVHGAGSVQGPPSPAVLVAAASASSAGLSNAPWRGCNRFRRLALRYERRADIHEAFLTLGYTLIIWRYLKREF